MDLENYPIISIVVPCFNVEHVVAQCIDALLIQDYPQEKFTVIIVNDKSSDATDKIIQKYENHNQVKIIQHFKNRGLAAARNSGIKASKSEIIGFLDSDMVVDKDWAKNMLEQVFQDGVVACMGGIRLTDSLKHNELDKYLYNPTRGVLKHGEGKPIRFKWFLFNNSVVKRSAINEIGLFDETITSYGGEDTDFAIRLWDKYPNGLRFTNNAIGQHYHQRSLGELKEKMEHYGSTTYLKLIKRYPNHTKDLAGDWIGSVKGKLVFNPIVNAIIKAVYFIVPVPYFVRYFIAYALMKGARKPSAYANKLSN